MYKSFKDIPQFPFASYRINVSWDYLPVWIKSQGESKYGMIELNPPYQRGYVWTQEQKELYLEYRLRGGMSGKDIFWNCPNWMSNTRPDKTSDRLELVDGKQRIDAVLGFLDNKVKAFGKFLNEYEGKLHGIHHDFVFHVNNLDTEKEVVEWYLGLNKGGSVHTEKDLEPAYQFLKKVS